jgi:hypothetical protein
MTVSRYMRPLLVLWLAAGCSSKLGPAIRVDIAHPATGDGRCAEPGADDPSVSSSGATLLRLSVRKHGSNDPTGTFLCDSLFKVPSDRIDLKLPVKGQSAIDLYAEAFVQVMDADSATAGNFRRVATGSLLDVDLKDKTFGPIRLYPVQKFRCVGGNMIHPRAFHTATRLPNGQVLFLGGATADATGMSDTPTGHLLFITGAAEVYDPSDGTFKAVGESANSTLPSPAPRAFHQAFYLGDNGSGGPPYNVLLVGGVTSTDGSSDLPVLGPTNSGVGGPRLVPFDTSRPVPSPLPAIGATAELVSYDPTTLTVTRMPVTGFAAAAFLAGTPLTDGSGNADGFAVAGGVSYGDPLETTTPAPLSLEVQRGSEQAPRAADLKAGRIGPGLVQLSDDAALLWGGGLTGGASQAEIITGLNSMNTPSSSALGLPGVPVTQFNTATLVDPMTSSVLVTGGFDVDASGNAAQPPDAAQAVQLITVDTAGGTVSNKGVPFGGTYVSDASTCSNSARYRPAGWESAITLPGGRGVLITGGAPTFDSNRKCNDCESGSKPTTLLCSSKQASLYGSDGKLSPAADSLQVSRYGHSSTVLPDGTVLIAGGYTLAPNTADVRLAPDAEVYNPVPSLPPYNMTDAMPEDLDDPLLVDLMGGGLQRAPGGQAFTSDPKKPAHSCGKL